ncbi:MAG: hypothetical protein ACI3XJ_03605 [Oscillospiraceae bacterium]
MDNTHIVKVTAITEVFGEGQKTIAAAVEYDTDMDPNSLSPDKFRVEGRTIVDLYCSGSAARINTGKGPYVILELDRYDPGCKTVVTCPRTDGGVGSIAHIITPRPVVSQVGTVKTADGAEYPAQAPVSGTDVINLVADDFKVCTYHLADGRKVDYNLFVPNQLEPGREYPLVYFITDAGMLSQDMGVALAQGLGATVWATPEEQAKHPCFVLAPQFHGPDSIVQDDFSCTWEVDAAYELVRHIMEVYPIDQKRVYGTGQSMGCMTACELNIRDPELYGGCLLIGGQWDSSRIAAAKKNNFWICVSSGDRKAFPGMNEITAALEEAGETVVRATLDATDMPSMNRIVKELSGDGHHIHYTWFEGNTVIPDGVEPNGETHHINSWRVAYAIEALRDWLFEQHRP